MAFIIYLLLLLITVKGTECRVYTVRVERLSKEPILSFWSPEGTSNNTQWRYNYNAAYLPTTNDPGSKWRGYDALAVRVQNLIPLAKSIYDVGPSEIALTMGKCTTTTTTTTTTTMMMMDDNHKSFCTFNASMLTDYVMIKPGDDPSGKQSMGCEDPRIVHHNGTLYMFYTAVHKSKDGRPSDLGNIRAQLALATCQWSQVHSLQDFRTCWKLRGTLFDDIFWTKSGALLIRGEQQDQHYYYPHLLFFGDSDIQIAVTSDLLHYNVTNRYLVSRRQDSFDSELVESGPEPLQLSDGNYLFLYNSARKVSIPNPKPGWHLEYNLGFVILDKNDPTRVIYRSNEPIMSPVLDWERCDNSPSAGQWSRRGLTPLVIFVEGWRRIPGSMDQFLIFYQGCDSVTSVARLTVDIQ